MTRRVFQKEELIPDYSWKQAKSQALKTLDLLLQKSWAVSSHNVDAYITMATKEYLPGSDARDKKYLRRECTNAIVKELFRCLRIETEEKGRFVYELETKQVLVFADYWDNQSSRSELCCWIVLIADELVTEKMDPKQGVEQIFDEFNILVQNCVDLIYVSPLVVEPQKDKVYKLFESVMLGTQNDADAKAQKP